MIEYGLSNRQLKELTNFSNIFNKTNDQMVLDCILLILCRWNDDKERFNNGRGFDPDISEVDFSIDSPKYIEDELYELSDDHDLSIYDCINGVVGLVLVYLDLNWSGEFGLESDNMTDEEKVIELTKENEIDDHCWVKYFGDIF
jgi:hypothetical protein